MGVNNTEQDEIELEEELHDLDTMCAVSVIEAEMELMKTLIKKSSGHEKEFYSDKLGNLEFQKNTIESNIQIGIITPERYLGNLKKYQTDQESLYKSSKVEKLGRTNKHAVRILRRIELVKIEINDMENPPEEEEEEQPVQPEQKVEEKKAESKPEQQLELKKKEPSFDEN